MRLVLFDIDGTLLPGKSSESRFILHLFKRGWLGPRQLIAALGFMVRFFPDYGLDVTKKNKSYLAGLRVEKVAALAAGFVENRLSPCLYGPSVARLQQHLDEGDRVILLSGTPGFIAKPLAQGLGVHGFRATRCASRNGRFIASRPLRHPYGEDKLVLAREIAREEGLDLSEAVAYGDSYSDAILFRAVGHSVAVMPDRRLREVASGEGWEIMAGPV